MESSRLLIGRIEENGLVVVTNCADHDIPLGAQLSRLTKEQAASSLPDIIRTELGEFGSVSLVVEEITLKQWGSPVESIPMGWSAALRLSGTGIDTLIRVLEEAADSEQVFLDCQLPPNNSFKPNPLRGSA